MSIACRRLPFVLLFAMLATTVAGCSHGSWRGTVKIGFVGPFSGYDTTSAYDDYRALQLAVEEWNDNGGVVGYRVEVVALDDRNQPLEAALQAREMAADPDVLGVVGYFSAETAAAAEREHALLGLPALVLAAGWEGAAPPGVLRLGPAMEEMATEAADWLQERSRGGPVAVVYEERGPAERGLAENLARLVQSEARARGLSADSIRLGRYDRNWPELARRLRVSKARAVYYSGSFEPLASFWAAEGGSLPGLELLASDKADTPDFARLIGGKASAVVYQPSTYDFAMDDRGLSFEARYRKLTGKQPRPNARLTYAAAVYLLQKAAAAAEGDKKPNRRDLMRLWWQPEQSREGAGATLWESKNPSGMPALAGLHLATPGYPGPREVP